MTDMYNPTTGAHYLASASQIRVLEKYGWVVYADWLKNNPQPAPTTTTNTTPTDTTTGTTTGTTSTTTPTDTTTSTDSPVTLV